MAKVTAELIRLAARQVRVWRGATPLRDSSPNLLLLHGGLGDARWHWQTAWEPLADSFQLAAPDLPHFGGTVELPHASFTELVEWIARVQELVGLSQAAIVGHSFGAGLARLHAAAHPERVTHLMLVAGGNIARAPKLVRRAMGSRLFSPLYELFRKQAFSEAGIRRAFANRAAVTREMITASQDASHGFAALMRQVALSDVPMNRTPRVPTLLVWGERDRLAPLARAYELAAEIHDARLAVIKNAGHLPQIEDPLSFLRVVREFCGVA